MPENQGDRRGLNPRQPEPQSDWQVEISTTYAVSLAVAGHGRIALFGCGRTRSGKSAP